MDLDPLCFLDVQDIVTRYAATTGHHVIRRFGWDCHGLPVEYEIDKKLSESPIDADRSMRLGDDDVSTKKSPRRRGWGRVALVGRPAPGLGLGLGASACAARLSPYPSPSPRQRLRPPLVVMRHALARAQRRPRPPAPAPHPSLPGVIGATFPLPLPCRSIAA